MKTDKHAVLFPEGECRFRDFLPDRFQPVQGKDALL